MKLVRNTGTDRVVDLLRPGLTAGRQLDVVTPALSLFAFSEMLREVATLVRCRLLLPAASVELAVLGSDADRAARNRLQTRWVARRLVQWVEDKAEVRRVLGAEKSVYEQVVYDSNTEATFADQLEKNLAIKVYAKLPGWFTVPTPLGSYNPDWAVLVEKDGGERLYFVVETKSGLFADELRYKERAKIECGKAHFSALAVGESPAQYIVAKDSNDLLA